MCFLDDDLFLDGRGAADEKLTLPGAKNFHCFPKEKEFRRKRVLPPSPCLKNSNKARNHIRGVGNCCGMRENSKREGG